MEEEKKELNNPNPQPKKINQPQQKDQEYEQFIEILHTLKRECPVKLNQTRKNTQADRFLLFKEDKEKYKAKIFEQVQNQELEMQAIMDEILASNNYDSMKFELAVQKYSIHQEVQILLQEIAEIGAIQQEAEDLPSWVTEELFEQILAFQCEQLELYSKQITQRDEQNVVFYNVLVIDEIYDKWGLSELQINQALVKYVHSTNNVKLLSLVKRIRDASYKLMGY